MKYFLTIIFSIFILTNIYILYGNRKATTKRKAYRWWLIVWGAFLAVYLSIAVADKAFLVVFLPMLAAILFGLAKFTKFCDWCGGVVQINLPFGDRNKCPRCGSTIS